MPYTPEEKCRLSKVLIVLGLLLVIIAGALFYYYAFLYPSPPPASEGDIFLLALAFAIALGLASIVIGLIWYSYCVEIRIMHRLAGIEKRSRRRRKSK